MSNNKTSILFIAPDYMLGGSTASLLNMIKSLKDEITPIVLFPLEDEAAQVFRQNNIECYVFPFINLLNHSKNHFWEVWKHPWRWHFIKKIRFDIGCLYFVRKQLKNREIDIVYSNSSVVDIGVLLARLLSAKHIWHVREFIDLDFHRDLYGGRNHVRKLICQANARIAVSSAVKNHWRLPDKNTWIIPNAVGPQSEASYVTQKEKYFLFCSYNLSDAKGVNFSIIAFAKSGKSQDGYRLKLIGNCSEEYKCKLIKTAVEQHVIESIDIIPNQFDVKPWFLHATAYIMASDCEAFGRVTAEAMFFGCPVVARATGGTIDLIKHGQNGWLFNTVDECAFYLRKVCDVNQQTIIMNAYEFAITQCSEEVYSQRMKVVFNQVLKNV